MKKELKKAIISFMLENEKDSQLLNITNNEFRAYIYDSKGQFLIGGKDVTNFILMAEKLITL